MLLPSSTPFHMHILSKSHHRCCIWWFSQLTCVLFVFILIFNASFSLLLQTQALEQPPTRSLANMNTRQHATWASPPAVMPTFSPPAPLLWVLLCVSVALQRSDMRLAYVTHNSFYYYSCSQDPQPCSVSSLTDCRCKDIQLSTLHRPQSHSSPVFRMRRLTVWYTSPSNTARLLNNSEVRHLTLVYCGTGGSRETATHGSAPVDGHFAVQHLERLSVVNLTQAPAQDTKVKNTDPERDNGAHFDRNRYKDRDTNVDLIADLNTYSDALSVAWSSPQIQDIFLGRELGAAYHEQARLAIIHSSVLGCAAEVKVYTVQTHIDSDGVLPFPELHLPKLPETSVIYVSFVYWYFSVAYWREKQRELFSVQECKQFISVFARTPDSRIQVFEGCTWFKSWLINNPLIPVNGM